MFRRGRLSGESYASRACLVWSLWVAAKVDADDIGVTDVPNGLDPCNRRRLM